MHISTYRCNPHSPSPTYSPWFGTVLKASRVAVKVLALLEEESRASKLSFNDVVKRLADAAPEDPTFVSTKVWLCTHLKTV